MSRRNFCTKHFENDAVGRCASCNNAFCGQCEVSDSAGRFCAEACRNRYNHYYANQPRTARKQSLGSKILSTLVFFGFLFGVVYYYGHFKGMAWAKAILKLMGL